MHEVNYVHISGCSEWRFQNVYRKTNHERMEKSVSYVMVIKHTLTKKKKNKKLSKVNYLAFCLS